MRNPILQAEFRTLRDVVNDDTGRMRYHRFREGLPGRTFGALPLIMQHSLAIR